MSEETTAAPEGVAKYKNDVLSGITVSLALVPEAIAFAFVCRVSPMVGLYAAFIMGLVTAVFGGRPGMISGATGAVAVVYVALVSQHKQLGVEYLFAAVTLAGIFQICAGLFKLGKFVRLIPHPVMLGFVNGLAIVIFRAQLGQFKVKEALSDGTVSETWLEPKALTIMCLMVGVTMAICYFMPKFTKAVPASLTAIIVVTLAALGLSHFGIYDARNVMDFVTMNDPTTLSLEGGFPAFHIPAVPFTVETLMIILPFAFLAAAVGLIESLLTLTLIDELTETRGQGNRECIGQGLGNLTCGFFGGMGGCAMIGQSMINIKSGGRGRLSGITAAVGLLAFVMIGSKFIQIIPLAALVGVMFMVVIATFEWSSLRLLGKVPKSDIFVIVLVSAVTVFVDLAIAVIIGVIVSALVFAWKKGSRLEVATEMDHKGSKIYKLRGHLFFGSAQTFGELFTPQEDPDDVVIDFHYAGIHDHSAIEAIRALADRYSRVGKRLHLVDLSPECAKLLANAGNLVDIKVWDDLKHMHVATDQLG